MYCRALKFGLRTSTAQHAYAQALQRRQPAVSATCCWRFSCALLPHPDSASMGLGVDLSLRRKQPAPVQHSLQRCYCQQPAGPRSLQSIAEERRRQADADASGPVPAQHRRSVRQPTRIPRTAHPSSSHERESADDNQQPVRRSQPSRQRVWALQAAQRYGGRRRMQAAPEGADDAAEDGSADSQTSK